MAELWVQHRPYGPRARAFPTGQPCCQTGWRSAPDKGVSSPASMPALLSPCFRTRHAYPYLQPLHASFLPFHTAKSFTAQLPPVSANLPCLQNPLKPPFILVSKSHPALGCTYHVFASSVGFCGPEVSNSCVFQHSAWQKLLSEYFLNKYVLPNLLFFKLFFKAIYMNHLEQLLKIHFCALCWTCEIGNSGGGWSQEIRGLTSSPGDCYVRWGW